MTWVRLAAASAALGVHASLLALLVAGALQEPYPSALQSGEGKDELSVVATITMTSVESLGLDLASTPRREASPGGEAVPKVNEAAIKEEEKIEAPVEDREAPPPVEEKKPDEKLEQQPSTPATASEAEDERRAASRVFEARKSRAISFYNNSIYQSLMAKRSSSENS